MKRCILLISLVLFAFAGHPATVHAAPAGDAPHAADALQGDEHEANHGGKPSVIAKPNEGAATAITALVVFVLVIAILSSTVWPKVSKGLAERNEKIQGEIAAAEDARKQAKAALAEYERNLAEARAEAQKMLEETRAQQGALAAELKAKADTELSAMREKAKAEIEAAKKQALAEIYTESVNLASVMASKILQREVTASDQQRLMDESLAEMKAVSV